MILIHPVKNQPDWRQRLGLHAMAPAQHMCEYKGGVKMRESRVAAS